MKKLILVGLFFYSMQGNAHNKDVKCDSLYSKLDSLFDLLVLSESDLDQGSDLEEFKKNKGSVDKIIDTILANKYVISGSALHQILCNIRNQEIVPINNLSKGSETRKCYHKLRNYIEEYPAIKKLYSMNEKIFYLELKVNSMAADLEITCDTTLIIKNQTDAILKKLTENRTNLYTGLQLYADNTLGFSGQYIHVKNCRINFASGAQVISQKNDDEIKYGGGLALGIVIDLYDNYKRIGLLGELNYINELYFLGARLMFYTPKMAVGFGYGFNKDSNNLGGSVNLMIGF